MNLTALTFQHSRLTVFLVIAVTLAGLMAYSEFPSQEEPSFLMREALVAVRNPGLPLKRIETSVVRPMEERIRALVEVKHVIVTVRDGAAFAQVQLHDATRDPAPVWQRLRAQLTELQAELPEGTSIQIDDDFGRTAAATLALVAPGYGPAEQRRLAISLRNHLYSLPGVERVTLHGLPEETVYIELSRAVLVAQPDVAERVATALKQHNVPPVAGVFDGGSLSITVSAGDEFHDDRIIGGLPVLLSEGRQARIDSVARIRRAVADVPVTAVLFNGRTAMALGVSLRSGTDIRVLGERLHRHIDAWRTQMPAGVELHAATDQTEVVSHSIGTVKRTFYETLLAVMAVVVLFLGARIGVVVGALVPLTLLASLLMMAWLDIPLQNVSIAAFIISLGLLVDNGIVVAEDIARRIDERQDLRAACIEAGRSVSLPLLTSTLTIVFGFLPLMLSDNAAGEYARSLSQVITITLLVSLLLSLTVTPLMCSALSSRVAAVHGHHKTYTAYRRLLIFLLDYKGWFVATMLAALAGGIWLLMLKPVEFLPNSDRPQFQITVETDPGSGTLQVLDSVRHIAVWLNDRSVNPEIVSHISYVGDSGPRFIAGLNPPLPGPNKAYLIVNIKPGMPLTPILERVRAGLPLRHPEARIEVKPFSLGSNEAGTLVLRLSGTDKSILRTESERLQAALTDVPGTRDIRADWEGPVFKLHMGFDPGRAHQAGVSRADVLATLTEASSGQVVTNLLGDVQTIPVLMRAPRAEQMNLDQLDTMTIMVPEGQASMPLKAVSTLELRPEETAVVRRDLIPTISVSAINPAMPAAELYEQILPVLDKIELLAGYRIELGGDIEESASANEALFAWLPVSLAAMAVVFLLQFRSFRRLGIIVVSIPFCLVGVGIGLNLSGASLGFMTVLGIFSLAGIIVNNAVLLIERTDAERHAGLPLREAVLRAAELRLRPILMTKLTCIAGLVPLMLFGGNLWYGLAVAIASGLLFGTLITLGLIPILYELCFAPRPRLSLRFLQYKPG